MSHVPRPRLIRRSLALPRLIQCVDSIAADKVRLEWFTGDWLHALRYPLGFDASDGMHGYAIRWTNESLEWRVDGELVYHKVEKHTKRANHASSSLLRI